jgi:hypothetical protein
MFERRSKTVYTEICEYGTGVGTMTDTKKSLQPREMTERKRLTLDLDPELHLRIKIAAAQAHLSMREYLEEILRQTVPLAPREIGVVRQSMPVTAPDIFARLARTRRALSGGRMVSDSTEIIRRMRDEQPDEDEKP